MFSQCPELPEHPVEIDHLIFRFFSAKELWPLRICHHWKGFIEEGMVSGSVLTNINKYKSHFGLFYHRGYLLLHIDMGSFFQNFPDEDKLISSINLDFPFLENFLSIQKSKMSLTFCSKDAINFYPVVPIPTCSDIYFKHPANDQIHRLNCDSQSFTLYEEMPTSFKSLKRISSPLSSKKIASYKRLTQKDEELILRFILLKKINFNLVISEDVKLHYPMPYDSKDCENKPTLGK